MKAARRRDERGFTMIEMILVVVVTGLAMTIAVRSMGSTLRASHTSSASQVLAADLERAFATAALQRTPVRITWTAATMTYSLSDRRTGTAFLTRSIGATADAGVASATFSVSPVDVFPGGTASSALTVTLGSGKSSHVVVMTRAGLVRVN